MRRHSHTRIVASSATKTQQTVDASEVDSARTEVESEQQESKQAQVKGTCKWFNTSVSLDDVHSGPYMYELSSIETCCLVLCNTFNLQMTATVDVKCKLDVQ